MLWILNANQLLVSPVVGKANQLEVLVQGKQGKLVTEYLIGNGVPKRWIELEDTTEKKGK
jgi:translation initiation factor 2D